jgi:hypothetical protein
MAAPSGPRRRHFSAAVNRYHEPDCYRVMNAVASAPRVSRLPMFAPVSHVEE